MTASFKGRLTAKGQVQAWPKQNLYNKHSLHLDAIGSLLIQSNLSDCDPGQSLTWNMLKKKKKKSLFLLRR